MRSPRPPALLGTAAALVAAIALLSGCSSQRPAAADLVRPTARTTAYPGLVVPVRLVAPRAMPLEIQEARLLTWKVRENDDDKIRIMDPATVAPAGAAPMTAPADYHAYLAGLRSLGARLSDDHPITVGGFPGRMFTITSTRDIDSGLGCWSDADDGCFGLPSDLVLRMATVTVEGKAVVLWARTTTAAPNAEVVAAFESMLRTVEFA